MPATRTLLLHQLSLLLLVGSSPLGAAAAVATPGRSSPLSPAAEPSQAPGAAREGASLAAPTDHSPESSEPAAQGPSSSRSSKSRSLANMSHHKAALEGAYTATRTSSFQALSTEAFSTLDSSKGRMLHLLTNTTSGSATALGTIASSTATITSTSVILAQDTSSGIQTRRPIFLPVAVASAENKSVSLTVPLSKKPVSEDRLPASESSHHAYSSWDADNTTPSSQTEGTDRSTFSRAGGRTSPFLTDGVTMTDSTRKGPVSETEISPSFDQSQVSSHTTQSKRRHVTPNLMQFPDSSTRLVLTHLQLSPITAVEDSDQSRSSSNMRTSIFTAHTDHSSVTGVSGRDGERTLQTQRERNNSSNEVQMPTVSSNKMSTSSDLTPSYYVSTPVLTSGRNLSPEDTEAAFIPTQAPSETTAAGSGQHIFNLSSTGKRTLRSPTEHMLSSATPVTGANDGTLGSLTERNKSTGATEQFMLSLNDVSSSDLTPSPSVTTQSGRSNISSTEVDFPDSPEEPLFTYSFKTSIFSSSTIDVASSESNHKSVDVSDANRRLSSVATDSIYRSTTFTQGGARTLRSLPDNSSTFLDTADSSTSYAETSRSSHPALTLTSVADTGNNMSLSDVQFTESSTKRLLEQFSVVPVASSSSEDPSTFGTAHHSVSISSTEIRSPQSYTVGMSRSKPFSRAGHPSQSEINTSFTEVTESTSSYMGKSSASQLNHSSSDVYSRRTGFSVQPVLSTETFQSPSSSRTSTYVSFQSDPSDTGNDDQPMSRTDTGNRTSASHTDSMYISTTFTRGGERTLLSISKNSTSESATFYTETSSPSESMKSSSSVTQSRGSNVSLSDRLVSIPSTEPLTVRSLKTSRYSATVNEPHTTQLYSNSESTSADSLSFSSSPPTSSQQDSFPSTQPPALFSSSESSLPSTSSAFLSLLLSPSPQTPLMTFSSTLSLTALPTLSSFSSLSPSLSSISSLLQPVESFEAGVSMATSEGTTGLATATAGSTLSKDNHHTRTYPLKDSTALKSMGPSHLTETTEQFANPSSSVTVSLGETRSSREPNVSLPGTSVEKSILTTSPTYLSESSTVSVIAKTSTSELPSTVTQKDVFSFVKVTTGETVTIMTSATLRLPALAPVTDYSITTKSHKVQPPSSTKIVYTSGTPTKGTEMSTRVGVEVTEHLGHITHSPKTFSSSKTTAGPYSTSPVPIKPSITAWSERPKNIPTSHEKDIDECLSNPCPDLATCTNTEGSFHCTCSLGYQMERGKCNLVRTFVGQFPLMFNTTVGKYSELHKVEEDIIKMLNSSLSTLPGYYTSTVKALRQSGTIHVSILSTFSLLSNVTLYDIVSTVRSHIQACKAPTETCQLISNLTVLHRGIAGGLCKHKDPECDKETSVCTDLDGLAVCQCKFGYFKYNKLDHSCRACEDGYKLANDTCVRCPFGLGGFNCGNPYQLITIVIAAAGGGLLLVMGIALIVTCCQKNKNDISKLIFKSGDFQMSPYAEYPKSPRVQDWGRETIEMQENGSTKNLLQMTDVYYMPTNLRNPELERNGVYPPYTGLPGSRHSCIYPGQYNPTFVSDDSKRRDYF